jgi:LmbE family N-acetylglucosaminyl deacetylase
VPYRAAMATVVAFHAHPDDEVLLTGGTRPGAAITHRIDVRRFARQKQAALACHHSVVHGRGGLAPVMRVLVRLTAWVFGLLLGREWFVEPATSR